MADKRKFTALDVLAMAQKKHPQLLGSSEYERYSTRVPYIDRILGGSVTRGGVPKGGVVEISGEFSSGKTTTILQILRQILDSSPSEDAVLIFDYEHSMDKMYAQKAFGLELDNSNPRVQYYEPITIGDARKILGPLFKISEEVGYCPVRAVAMDSVAAMNPDAMMEAAYDGEKNKTIGLQARELGQFLTEYVGLFEKFGVTLLLANQVRSKVKLNMYEGGPSEDTSGGRALKFYSWIRMVLKPRGNVRVKAWDPVSGERGERDLFKKIQITTIKNKTAPPYLTDEVYIRYGSGFDNAMTAVTKGQVYGLFHPDAMSSMKQQEEKKERYVTGDGRKGFTVWKLKVDPKDPWVCQVLDKKNSTGRRVVDKEALLTAPTLVDLAEELKKNENKPVWKYLIKEILRHYQRDLELFLAPGERKDLHDLVLDDDDDIQDAVKESAEKGEDYSEVELLERAKSVPTDSETALAGEKPKRRGRPPKKQQQEPDDSGDESSDDVDPNEVMEAVDDDD